MKSAVWWSATSLSFVDVEEGPTTVVFGVQVFYPKGGSVRFFMAKCHVVQASSKLIIISQSVNICFKIYFNEKR